MSQHVLNSDSAREWIVIPAKSRRIPAKSEKMAGIQRNPVNPLLRRQVSGQICSFPTSLGPKKIRNREREKKKLKPARFCRIPTRFSLESLLRAFWEKKIESAYIERNWNFGGAHCEFLNIGDRIEKHPKFQGANSYFPLIFHSTLSIFFFKCFVYIWERIITSIKILAQTKSLKDLMKGTPLVWIYFLSCVDMSKKKKTRKQKTKI